MIEAAGCTKVIFDIPITSGLYSQMSGVLAGFTFASIVLLLTRARPVENVGHMLVAKRNSGNGSYSGNQSGKGAVAQAGDKGILAAFITALLILTTTMLTYAVLAGEPLPGALGRAATEELLDGVPLTFAVMMLFHGMALLIEKADISKASVLLSRAMAGIAVPGIAMWYLGNAAADTVAANLVVHSRHTACTDTAPVPALGVALTMPLIVTLTLILIMGRSDRMRDFRTKVRRVETTAPVVCVAISVGVTFLSGFVSTRSGGFVMASWVVYLYLVTTFIVLLFTGVIVAVGGTNEPITAGGKHQTSVLRAPWRS